MQLKGIKSTAFLIALILATLVPVLGQSSPGLQQEDPIVVSSNLVTVNVIVTDKNGRYVKGLRSDQFSIYDENARQKISHFSVGSAPVSIGIVYEVRSASVSQVSGSLAALKQFVAALREGDNFFLHCLQC